MPIKKFSDVEATEIKAGKDTTIQVLIAPDEAPNFAMRRIVMQAGGSMPAGQPHFYETIGDEPFEFLCSVPNKPDKIEIVE